MRKVQDHELQSMSMSDQLECVNSPELLNREPRQASEILPEIHIGRDHKYGRIIQPFGSKDAGHISRYGTEG